MLQNQTQETTKVNKIKKSKKDDFDKYDLYIRSVQSPETDVKFLRRVYKELRGKKPISMREDFCGTFALSCEWVKLKKEHKAIGVDLDAEPISYGREHYFSQLKESQQERVEILQANVLDPKLPKADIIQAQNFSYFIFKKREQLREYFKNSQKTLNKDGIFVVDCFGGSQCMEPNEEETEHKGFSYFGIKKVSTRLQMKLNFIFTLKEKVKKREQVFSYDWRMWSIPEVREVMLEAGFKDTAVYWEGTDEDGEGDGEFSRVDKGEECESWVAYIVGLK
ncbi:MAG: class I SAM-dependent methyltransferase [Bdellovibrionales bacterium]